jgi:regulator of replication initiation timing
LNWCSFYLIFKQKALRRVFLRGFGYDNTPGDRSFGHWTWMAVVINLGSIVIPKRLRTLYWSVTNYVAGCFYKLKVAHLESQIKALEQSNTSFNLCVVDQESQIKTLNKQLKDIRANLDELSAEYLKLITEKDELSKQLALFEVESIRLSCALDVKESQVRFVEHSAQILQAYEAAQASSPYASWQLRALVDQQIPCWRDELQVHLKGVEEFLTQGYSSSENRYLLCRLQTILTHQITHFECMVKLMSLIRVSDAVPVQPESLEGFNLTELDQKLGLLKKITA